MFCFKCGTKAIDGAEFCQKCGTKLIVDTPAGQSAAATSSSPPQPPNQVPTNTPVKKKSKLPIILGTAGALLLVLVVLAAIGHQNDPDPSVNSLPGSTQSDASTPSSTVSNTGSTVSNTPSKTSAPTNQILLRGTPIENLMGAESDEILSIFGKPDSDNDSWWEYNSTADESFSFAFDEAGRVDSLDGDPVIFTFNGQNLAQDLDSLATILGDDYDDQGGTAYMWDVEWSYGDYRLHFNFPRGEGEETAKAFFVFIYSDKVKTDDDDFVDNDALLGDASGYVIRDSELYGRWRSYDGGYVEFGEYGNAALSFSPQGSMFRPDYISWESGNGQIIFKSHFSSKETWELSTSGQKKVLVLSNALQSTRYVSSDADDSLAGTWDRLSDPNDIYQYTSSGALVLSSDGTGTMDKLTSSNTWTLEAVPISWWLDGTKFHMEWTLQSACDYTIYGNTLTLFFSDGSQMYTKVGS